ncbi:Piso0_004839 [Millerozyma farinosa CBS 7064]|uniref:Piso0_004839 protein n=1 Tax=Pichia sorbitophila (strain ATCC MYA-4447 / BCRC 22081 / CBS 7064 / NBRC 10061 / NRRL Y-12695) TaxID=559304 RepID=G8Y0K2_PICSO|nr:Piso0_004839 [Millerozyma farinosa CBS 7064]
MMEYHLVILVHGLWGQTYNLNYLERQVREQVKPAKDCERILVHKTGSHAGFLTYDGLDVNGKRIADEVTAETKKIRSRGDKVTKLSVVGYSVGGVIARYAIGVLYSEGYYDKVKPMNFVTFCSPHVGTIFPGESWSARLFNAIIPFFLAHTGAQIFMRDRVNIRSEYSSSEKRNLPLLVWMAERNSVFYKALAVFQNRALYCNVINDKRTSWYTCAISAMDPFNSMVNEEASIYDFEYIEKYSPVVIDLNKPIALSTLTMSGAPAPSDKKQPSSFSIGRFFRAIYNWLRVLVGLLVVSPFFFFNLACISLFVRVKMVNRVKCFFRDTSLMHLYEFAENLSHNGEDDYGEHKDEKYSSGEPGTRAAVETMLSDAIGDQTEIFVNSVYNAMNGKYPANYEQESAKQEESQESEKGASMDGVVKFSHRDSLPLLFTSSSSELKNLNGERINDFRLNLTEYEKYVIKELNTLKWNKYPVFIRKTKASHAAIIVRHGDPAFEEGITAVNHFVREAFQTK